MRASRSQQRISIDFLAGERTPKNGSVRRVLAPKAHLTVASTSCYQRSVGNRIPGYREASPEIRAPPPPKDTSKPDNQRGFREGLSGVASTFGRALGYSRSQVSNSNIFTTATGQNDENSPLSSQHFSSISPVRRIIGSPTSSDPGRNLVDSLRLHFIKTPPNLTDFHLKDTVGR